MAPNHQPIITMRIAAVSGRETPRSSIGRGHAAHSGAKRSHGLTMLQKKRHMAGVFHTFSYRIAASLIRPIYIP